MRRCLVVVAGVAGAAAVVGQVLFAPLPSGADSGSVPKAAAELRDPARSSAAETADERAPELDGTDTSAHDHDSLGPAGEPPEITTDLPEDELDQAGDGPDGDRHHADGGQSAEAAGTPSPANAAAVAVAEQAVAAAARPASHPDGWWAGLAPFLSAQAADDLRPSDPTSVRYTRVTGAGRVVPMPTHIPALSVDVPTDDGLRRVELEPDDRRPSGWAVTSLAWQASPPPTEQDR